MVTSDTLGLWGLGMMVVTREGGKKSSQWEGGKIWKDCQAEQRAPLKVKFMEF